MGRGVSLVTESVWYVPDIDGNRADPDPFRVLIKPMTGRDAQALERSLVKGMVAGEKTDAALYARIDAAEKSYVADHVIEVQGYAVTNVATGEVITPKTGAELYHAVTLGPATERQILRDIVAAIEQHSKLSEGLLGKSHLQSASGRPATQQPRSGAVRAADEETETTAGVSETVTTTLTQTLLGSGHPDSGAALGLS